MKLYLAGSSLEAEMVAAFAQKVTELSHSITWSWWEAVLANKAAGIPDTALSADDRRWHAEVDLKAVMRAEVFWLLTPPTGGAGCFVELGAALSAGSIVVASGPWRTIFTELCDHRFSTHEEALAWLASISEPRGDAEAFSALLKADGPQDTATLDASDEPSAGDRHEFASLDEMIAGLGKAGA
jgi:hypothetical protein